MANKPLDTSLLDKAIIFAVNAHKGTERRGKGFPYIVHPLEAVEIVSTLTKDQELLAAAALHDTVEDTDVTVEDIRREFGDRVAKIVEEESDKFIEGLSEEDSWHIRKEAAIHRLKNASRDAKIVAMGDKLSNARAILRDHKEIGDKVWDLFHTKDPAEHEWHYRGLADALSDLVGSHAYTEFAKAINEIFGQPKPELINMDDYVESGDGYTAISYNHKNGKTMMKLYSDFIPSTEPAKELQVAWSVLDSGIVTPKALRLVTDGKRTGIEFERITPKKSIARAISEEPEKLEFYTREFARLCKKLHGTPCDKNIFNSAEEHFKKAINNNKLLTDEEKYKFIQLIANTPATSTCLHGDMHIGNMIVSQGKYYWIDLADFRYGNPYYDFGMFYFVCQNTPDFLVEKLYHITKAQILQVWEVFIQEYFGPDVDVKAKTAELAPYACLYMIFFSNRSGKFDPWMTEFMHQTVLK